MLNELLDQRSITLPHAQPIIPLPHPALRIAPDVSLTFDHFRRVGPRDLVWFTDGSVLAPASNHNSPAISYQQYLHSLTAHEPALSPSGSGAASTCFHGHTSVQPFFRQSLSLPRHSSIFQAECLAIEQSLHSSLQRSILPPPGGRIHFYVDSKAALFAICNPYRSRSRIVSRIASSIRRISSSSSPHHTSFSWIPAHQGYLGNEIADTLAKNGAKRGPGSRRHYTSPPLSAQKRWNSHFEKSFLQNFWNEKLRSPSVRQQLMLHFPDFPSMSSFMDIVQRLNAYRVTRLITGHYPTRSYLFKINQRSSPLCPSCQVTDTVNHYLFFCTYYTEQRRSWFNQSGRVIYSLNELTNPLSNKKKATYDILALNRFLFTTKP